MPEDVIKDLMSRDLSARNVGKLVKTDAQILTDEVAAKSELKSINDTEDGCVRMDKCIIMSDRCDNDAVLIDFRNPCSIVDGSFQACYILLQLR